ncbi:MAG: glycoside hydrolase family 16 protein, partial [Oscillospiraceae bacterium]|nr:glycoside hydrolase family 16 protein [Oscillospiraceae bacterium]
IHWDGYDTFYGSTGKVTDTGINLYEGWHTYALLWTPERYTFFVDGRATWSSNGGGISQVPAFLRLTVEVRRTEYGPYSQPLGLFASTEENPAVFEIDYVKVYQNTAHLPLIKAPTDFAPKDIPFIFDWFA